MDVQMPEMGGFEATAAIRDRERGTGGHVRIIAMTAHTMSGDRERCLAAGMDGYLAKPIDRAGLLDAVEPSPPAATIEARTDAPPFDRVRLLERVGGDQDLMHDVARLFVADCPARLAAVESAVVNADPERLRLAAHALRGMAGTLSAACVVDAAGRLESLAQDPALGGLQAAWGRLQAETTRLLLTLKTLDNLGWEATACAP